MNIKEKALEFAINAHKGQIRKNEPDKPMIIHPIGVGNILKEYGYEENVVAAGYLHDVVEDTKYTIEDIEKNFGSYIAALVESASEPDKSLSWEERKTHTIKLIKTLPIRNKVVIAADKISNLEDLKIKFQKTETRDFSLFKRGEKLQKWYYTSVYESLINNENPNLPIFKRLKEVIDIIFYGKEDLFLKETIFKENLEYYKKLKQLHAQKEELKKLKELCKLSKPFVIEFCGTPRTGKTTTINNIYDFFKKGGFNIQIIEEFTTSKYYKENLKNKYKNMNLQDSNIAILEEVTNQLIKAISTNPEIILIDRSINDRQIWNHRRYLKGDITEAKYKELKEKYSLMSKQLIDSLVITYAEPLISLQRDYNCSLALEKRTFLNIENIEEYNKSLIDLQSYFKESVENLILLDTTKIPINDIGIEIASRIMPAMRKKYIKALNKKYNL